MFSRVHPNNIAFYDPTKRNVSARVDEHEQRRRETDVAAQRNLHLAQALLAR